MGIGYQMREVYVMRGWDKKGQEGRKAGGQEVKNKGYK